MGDFYSGFLDLLLRCEHKRKSNDHKKLRKHSNQLQQQRSRLATQLTQLLLYEKGKCRRGTSVGPV